MGVIFPNVIVALPEAPATTLAEFVADAKQKPGQLTYATSGVGSAGHLAGEPGHRRTFSISGIENS